MKVSQLKAREVNTGGNCLVTIIECELWDYILVTNDECVAMYKSEDDFWDGKDCLDATTTELYINLYGGE